MRALVAHGAKDLRLEDRPPEDPGPGQVLIRLQTGGICGSDLHYYNHGGFGAVRLKEPMILGHEVAGVVEATAPDVTGLGPGDLVAVSPSRPCQACRFCHEGRQNHCLIMRFYGSAMPFPHIQGAFREYLVADAAQCAPARGLSPAEAAMAEPLSVVLHAARQAGDLMGRRVLVTGCGPIGMLAVLVARMSGTVEIAATDVAPFTLELAGNLGADQTVNVAENPEALAAYGAQKGHFDVAFECSGVPSAVAGAAEALRPGGVIVQLGLGGDMTLPVQAMTAKELSLRGSFRFHEEFFTAVALMQAGRIDVGPLVTQTLPLAEAVAAFDLASDRSRAVKVQLDFS